MSFLIAFVLPVQTEASMQKVVIRLGGNNCEFYLVDVATELKKVPGVKDVDIQTMRGHVIVNYVAGKMNPAQLLSAVNRVKGEGYHCKGQFEGQPGPVS